MEFNFAINASKMGSFEWDYGVIVDNDHCFFQQTNDKATQERIKIKNRKKKKQQTLKYFIAFYYE